MSRIFAAGLVAIAASLVSAGPSPVQIEARAATTSSTSLPTVTVSGNAFYAGSSRFYIRGVDYQPGGSSKLVDPLADATICQRDIPYFQKLGINTIRVYAVDNSANHDTCMNALAAAGIYVALDVNTPNYSINRANPGASYNPTYLQSVFATMDVFSQYTNTLAFFNGNEVINNATNSNCAPYVKAVGRDMKSYRVARGLRAVPIGYSAADIEENRYQSALYFNCGTDDQRSDFFAFNDYSWCDPVAYTFANSNWNTKLQLFSNYTIPLFLSEYGCITGSRAFDEVPHLYNEMTPVYSGGLVYEYTEEGNGYGIVSASGSSVTTLSGFPLLQTQLKNNPAPTGLGGAKTTSASAAACPTANTNWDVSAFAGSLLPAMPSGATKYLSAGAGTGPGLTGDGSQNASGGSTSTASAGSGSTTAYVTGKTSATSKGAASGVMPPPLSYGAFATVAIFFVSALFGAALL